MFQSTVPRNTRVQKTLRPFFRQLTTWLRQHLLSQFTGKPTCWRPSLGLSLRLQWSNQEMRFLTEWKWDPSSSTKRETQGLVQKPFRAPTSPLPVFLEACDGESIEHADLAVFLSLSCLRNEDPESHQCQAVAKERTGLEPRISTSRAHALNLLWSTHLSCQIRGDHCVVLLQGSLGQEERGKQLWEWNLEKGNTPWQTTAPPTNSP